LKSKTQHQSWQRFVELYAPLLYHWVSRYGVPASDAADVVQEVFVVLVEKLPVFDYDENGSFRGWLHTITRNKCHDRLRGLVADRKAKSKLNPEQAHPSAADVFTEAEYFQAVGQKALELMQREFEPSTWKACWDNVVEGKSIVEISARLGISVNAVYLSKSRVLRRLREELAGLLE
jgi:RNA polymerase sigma-70 factor (ECF subfamily)